MSKSDLSSNSDKKLLEILVEKNLISQAQAELIDSDSSATGMPIDEILMARGWVKEEDLAEFKPLIQKESAPDEAPKELSYQENLKNYRSILAEILGESSE